MSEIGIIGAGSIGLGLAAMLRRDGHDVRLWSRNAGPLAQMEITATGAVDWHGQVKLSSAMQDIAGAADILILCLPGNAQKTGIDLMLPHLAKRHTIIISAQYSLSGLYLAKRVAEAGLAGLPVIALATTILTGRRGSAGQVKVSIVRDRYDFAVLPPEKGAAAGELLKALTGKTLTQVPMPGIVFSVANPTAHAPTALCNLTRIEKGETWSSYGMMTETVCALIEKLDAERCAVARHYGTDPVPLTTHMHNSFGTKLGSMAEMAATITRTRGGPNGPDTLDTRYITEDIPFGLLPVALLGERAGVDVRFHRAFITLLSAACRRDFAAENDLLPALGLDALTAAQLQHVLINGWQ